MIRRLGYGYEADPDRRHDQLQEIHLELWRSLALFDGRRALRTWVYRVAHNVAASYIVRQRRIAARLVDLEALENCATFLRQEFESKRRGLLEIRRYIFRLISPILVSWWAGGPAIRLRASGVDPSSRLYKAASGPWPFIVIGFLLLLIWPAFGLAAKKATRELDELCRRTQE